MAINLGPDVIITDAEIAFIVEMSARFPDKNIQANFDRYCRFNNETCDPDSSFPEYTRYDMARCDAKTVMRAGYVRRGVPENVQQTLADHGHFVGRLAQTFKHASLTFRCPDEAKIEGEIHDLPEVIAGDFTPHDPITKDEKFRLEELAARVVFPKHLYDLWVKHETGTAPEQVWVRDCDLLEMPLHIVTVIEPRHPHLELRLQEFFGHVAGRLQTERAQEVFECLLESRGHRRQTGRTLGQDYYARIGERTGLTSTSRKLSEMARMVNVMGLLPHQ